MHLQRLHVGVGSLLRRYLCVKWVCSIRSLFSDHVGPIIST